MALRGCYLTGEEPLNPRADYTLPVYSNVDLNQSECFPRISITKALLTLKGIHLYSCTVVLHKTRLGFSSILHCTETINENPHP